VLQKICTTRHFDAKDAGEFTDNPFLDEAVHPFGKDNQTTTSPEPGPSSQPKKRKSSKGTHTPAHNSSKEKFNKNNIPKNIETIFKKQLKMQKTLKEKKKLRMECLKLIGNSLAKSTWNRYNCAFNLWQKFCKSEKSNAEKITENKKILFICWCSKNTKLQTSTISMYLSAITHCLSLLKGGVGKSSLQNWVTKGLQNINSKKKIKPKRETSPVTVCLLKKLGRYLNTKKGKRVTRLSAWAAALVAFWGCFRLGEILCKNQMDFDKFTDLTWKDVKLARKSVRIRIKSGKTSGSKPIFVCLGALPRKSLCPRRALNKLKRLQGEKGLYCQNLPVFRKGDGENFRPADMIQLLKKVMGPGQSLTGKSFRAGIPSALGKNKGDFLTGELKNFGRWKSAAFKTYIKGGVEDLDLYKRVTDFVLTH